MITDWYTLQNYGSNVDAAKSVYEFNSDLNAIVRVIVDKMKELDANANYQMGNMTSMVYTNDAKLFSLQLENDKLKKIITRMIEKNFPELMIEFPELLKPDER